MIKPIRKAVFPVAGLGTRLLPATKVLPKEMLPVVDKPIIQYAVEEAYEAGIEEYIFVTNRGKSMIEDHFDHAYELEAILAARTRDSDLKQLQSIGPTSGKMFYTRQKKPLGLGHAIWCAHQFVNGEAFAVISPDDLVLSRKGCLAQMMEVYMEVGGNVVGVEDIPREHTDRYGILDIDNDQGKIVSAKGLVEKPRPDDSPSTLSIIGRYILQKDVFSHLEKFETGAGGEIQLTDAIAKTIGSIDFHGVRFDGERFDCGTKSGFIAANIAYAIERNDLGENILEILKERLEAIE